ncbi:tyrosine-type recombinase/integrase [Erythrobacter rubeus]|uniref:Tyrosine-type recombinase/integrase n=1 Tax=Erythrobacter rubeus TaxID=2760803 RepID=A0ABR8KRE8_9SPHN|nr:tyrosine-type recombinase/integrase [Erythrobacter rubeus]MBD2840761.1 tyrosine-type recombinase/integrase [Erythrobacter rubeus]
MKRPQYVTKFRDRHGKTRYRFRRKGYPAHYFKAPFGTKDFEREYAACLDAEKQPVGGDRIRPGSVSDVIARYYADSAFLDLRPATQAVYRGVLERFRATFGDDPISRFDAARIQRLMNGMRDKPHAAARLRKLLHQLFIVARRERIVPGTFDPVKDTRPPKASSSEGYHRWTEAELTQFEAAHPLGTKPRLAFALLLYGAQRSADVRFLSRRAIAGGRIRLKQSKTSTAVDVPVVEPLREALEAGPLGDTLLLENNRGDAFTAKGFYNLMRRACDKAGLPHCSAHGLRKAAAARLRRAGCSDQEGMAITGHKSISMYRKYAGDAGDAALADSAMAKAYGSKVSNPGKRLDTASQKTAEDCEK